MHVSSFVFAALAAALWIPSFALADKGGRSDSRYRVRVIASGLDKPTGIVAGHGHEVYFTEVPTPGVNGPSGGTNGVKVLDTRRGKIEVINMGEPEPLNLAIDLDDNLYWTCRTAGVILRRDGVTCAITPLLTDLDRPTGLTTDYFGNIFYTELPTPGVAGPAGGMNTVSVDHGDEQRILDLGDPQPYDIAVGFGGVTYWTCTSAGVIVERNRLGEVRVLLSGLERPLGIAIDRTRDRLFWTEVPTPGVSGADGGRNAVWEYNLRNGRKLLVDAGDPEPRDVTVNENGDLYWTCTSAGVIVEAQRRGGRGRE